MNPKEAMKRNKRLARFYTPFASNLIERSGIVLQKNLIFFLSLSRFSFCIKLRIVAFIVVGEKIMEVTSSASFLLKINFPKKEFI